MTACQGAAPGGQRRDYGTRAADADTPGKGGQTGRRRPGCRCLTGWRETVGPLEASVLLAPYAPVKGAALEATEAGMKLPVDVPDPAPICDVTVIADAARDADARCAAQHAR
jgi:succinyl-CoA synthetase alpha subunit